MFHWIGLIHGHFDAGAGDIDALDVADESDKTGINTGIAIVVPVERILEVLDSPEFKQFEKATDEYERGNTATTGD